MKSRLFSKVAFYCLVTLGLVPQIVQADSLGVEALNTGTCTNGINFGGAGLVQTTCSFSSVTSPGGFTATTTGAKLTWQVSLLNNGTGWGQFVTQAVLTSPTGNIETIDASGNGWGSPANCDPVGGLPVGALQCSKTISISTANLGDDPAGVWTLKLYDNNAPATTQYRIEATTLEISADLYPSSGIRGRVYGDKNNNGALNTGESGLSGVTVEAYDSAGVLQGTTTTPASGIYSIAAGGAGPYRIEFSTLPSYYKPGIVGSQSNTLVQFAANANSENINLSLVNPYELLGSGLATTIQSNGSMAAQIGMNAIVDFNYDGTGSERTLGTGNTVGSTWGLAYDANNKKLYVSASMRRHSGLGPQGLGGIYIVDYSLGTPAVTSSLVVPNVGSNPRNYTLPNDKTLPSHDSSAFPAIGKVGIGDIDISADGSTLYVANLENQRLDLFDIATQAVTSSVSLGDIGCPSGASVVRPWAVKVKDGDVYMGAVCEDAPRAYVLKLNGAGTSFTKIDLDSTNVAVDYFDLSYQQ